MTAWLDRLINFHFHLAVPENSENEADALLHFTAEFSSRWASCQVMTRRTDLSKNQDFIVVMSNPTDELLFVLCVTDMERPTQCSILGLWRQRLKRPSMAKPEM